MAPPIFHIGYHKTATTWFQHRLYPHVANGSALPRDVLRELLILPRALAFDPQPVRDAIAALPSRALLCDEELSGNIHTGGHHGCLTKDLAERLHRVAPEATVVIFLRNQLDMVASVYRQYVRVGGSYGLGRYLDHEGIRPNRAPLFDLGHFDYAALVEHYASLFGRERLKVFLFEDFRTDSRGFLGRFVEDLGLTVDLDTIDLRPELPAYGDGTLRLARMLNRFSREELPFKYYAVHVPRLHGWGHRVLSRLNTWGFLKRARPARDFLGAQRSAAIEARFRESNGRLADAFGLPLADRGYPL